MCPGGLTVKWKSALGHMALRWEASQTGDWVFSPTGEWKCRDTGLSVCLSIFQGDYSSGSQKLPFAHSPPSLPPGNIPSLHDIRSRGDLGNSWDSSYIWGSSHAQDLFKTSFEFYGHIFNSCSFFFFHFLLFSCILIYLKVLLDKWFALFYCITQWNPQRTENSGLQPLMW